MVSANLGGELVSILRSRQGQVSVEQIVQIFYQTCSAVHHMHKQQPPVIHRDLKACIEGLQLEMLNENRTSSIWF